MYLDRDKDYMRKEVTVAQLDVLFRDSIGDLEKNRENVTNSEAEV
jgi:hypothetical protein